MTKRHTGWIEHCTQSRVTGWSTATQLEVYVNGECQGSGEIGGTRGDLIDAGFNSGRLFAFNFDRSLWLHDRVTIRLPDDTVLATSLQTSHTKRLMALVSLFDLNKAGLEFGPLNRPIIPREHARVFYVDHDTQDALKKKYAQSLGDETRKIQSVDFVWRNGETLEGTLGREKFSWAVASHVGEHIADFVGWLNQLSEVMEPAGVVSLALPHGERTFDACRPVSTFEDVISAHIMKLSRPSAHQVLRHIMGVSDYFKIDLRKPENLVELLNSLHVANAAHVEAYIDVHCHVFTPASFSEIYRLLEACNLVKLKLSSVTDTDRDEFFVLLLK